MRHENTRSARTWRERHDLGPDWFITALFVLLALTPFIGLAVRGHANDVEMGLASLVLVSSALGWLAHRGRKHAGS